MKSRQITLSLFLALIFLSPSSWAKMPSCNEVLIIAQSAAKLHLNKPKINEDTIASSAPVFLDILDPLKVYLIESEFNQTVNDFNKDKQKTYQAITKQDCSGYKPLEDSVKKGKERLQKLVEEALKLPEPKELKSLDRETPTKAFKTEEELKTFITYFVQKNLKVGKVSKKKPADIKKNIFSFFKLNKEKKRSYTDDDLRNSLITKSLLLTFDPHSSYISEDEAEEFNISITSNLQGVGLVLSEDILGAKILKIVKNGPAFKNGQIKVNDIITKVNNQNISDMHLSEIVNLIRGKDGTKVKIHLVREEKDKKITNLDVTLSREEISLEDQKAQIKEFKIKEQRILVINLPSFYYNNRTGKGASYDIMKLYKQEKEKGKIDGIILDLRNNGGGSLEEAVRISGIFIDNPIAVQVRDNESTKGMQSGPAPVSIKEPLVVMINKNSASASEIVAGALKDYGRAVIVGDEQSFGKGTVQVVLGNLREFKLGMIKVTTSKFYTPSGGSTQIKGVTSHIIIPSSSSLNNFNESHMRYALDWTKVDSVFTKEVKTPTLESVKELKSLSQLRVKENKDFEKFKNNESYRKWLDEEQAKENTDKNKDDDNADEETKFDPVKDIALAESLNISLDLINYLQKTTAAKK